MVPTSTNIFNITNISIFNRILYINKIQYIFIIYIYDPSNLFLLSNNMVKL